MPDSMDKNSLRVLMRKKRKELPQALRAELSAQASRCLMDEDVWAKAKVVALYMSMPDETDTFILLESAWKEQKEALLPLCSSNLPGHMDFIACTSLEHLKPGPFGILEPTMDCSLAPLVIPDIVLVPGVAFDRNGKRLGMGGGYYDRFFAKPEFSTCTRIGFAFEFQIVDDIPSKDWDQTVDALCTEKGFTWIKKT